MAQEHLDTGHKHGEQSKITDAFGNNGYSARFI